MVNSISARERMLTVYRGEIPDRMPVSIYNRYLPRGTVAREAKTLGMGVIDWYPVTSLIAPPWHMLPGYLSEVHGADLRISYCWENGRRIEIRTYDTPVGSVSQRITTDPAFGSDWIQEHYIKTVEDYKVVRYLVENSVINRHEEQLRTLAHNLGDDGVVLGRVDRNPYQKLLIELAGPERFLMDMYAQPQPVLELIEAIERRMDEVFSAAAESHVEVIWQPDNVTADLTPPSMYKKFCLPHYQKNGNLLHRAGKRYVVHMDGRLRPLKELIAESTFDAVESFSFPDVGGDLDFPAALAAWPDKAVLPNFPASLCNKSEQEINLYFRNFMNQVGDDKPCMLQVSEDIPPRQWQHVVTVLSRMLAPTFHHRPRPYMLHQLAKKQPDSRQ